MVIVFAGCRIWLAVCKLVGLTEANMLDIAHTIVMVELLHKIVCFATWIYLLLPNFTVRGVVILA